ncbi:hypothetical protein RB195_011008 [Necator americanus]|uniref:Uncharacterized protein n=1 Tax=Necator americanus TaxID=51031 RepID=A0ABR1D0R0_NECAM
MARASDSNDPYPRKKESRESSNYPQKKSGDKRSITDSTDYKKQRSLPSKAPQKSRRDFKRNFLIGIKILVFFEVLVMIGLVSMFYTMAVKRLITDKIKWELEQVPGTGVFEEFAVSSSSETCSELARTMYIEGYRSNIIAATLQFCLNLQQPDRSGDLGQSVAVHYSPEKGCRYTQGLSTIPKNAELVQTFVHAVNADPFSESRGPYSELLPLASITLLALIENTTASELEEAAVLMQAEHGDKIISLTTHAINPVELGFLIREEMLFIKGEEFTTRDRGEITTITEFEEKVKCFISTTTLRDGDALKEHIKEHLMPNPLHYGDPFTSDYSPLDEVGNKYWVKKAMQYDAESRSYCYPGDPSVAPQIFEAVHTMSDIKVDEMFDFVPDQAASILHDVMHTIYDTIANYEVPSEWVSLYMVSNQTEFEKSGLKSNMFTLAMGNEAYAFIGTLGTSFGSLSTTPFMNNLVHNVVKNFAVAKGFANSLHPFIGLQNNTVTIAYAGTPGFPTVSLGIPRLLSTIILSTLFGHNLEEAVIYPLLYPLPNVDNLYRYEHPYRSQFDKYVSGAGKKIVNVPGMFGDSIAAISRRPDKYGRQKFVAFYKNKKTPGRQFNTRIIGL